MKIQYLITIMFVRAKALDEVTEILKLAIPLRLMLSLAVDGPNVNKSILNKLMQVKKEEGYDS